MTQSIKYAQMQTNNINILMAALKQIQDVSFMENTDGNLQIRYIISDTTERLNFKFEHDDEPEPTFKRSNGFIDNIQQPHERFGSEDVTTDLGQSF